LKKIKIQHEGKMLFFLFLPALFVPLVIARGLTTLLLLNAGSPEAIHFDTDAEILDCFVALLLAMTGGGDTYLSRS
jgi:hypothetical protein